MIHAVWHILATKPKECDLGIFVKNDMDVVEISNRSTWCTCDVKRNDTLQLKSTLKIGFFSNVIFDCVRG